MYLSLARHFLVLPKPTGYHCRCCFLAKDVILWHKTGKVWLFQQKWNTELLSFVQKAVQFRGNVILSSRSSNTDYSSAVMESTNHLWRGCIISRKKQDFVFSALHLSFSGGSQKWTGPSTPHQITKELINLTGRGSGSPWQVQVCSRD